MSAEHLSKGSVYPPVTPGLLRCYSMRFCPFSQRIKLVLTAKNIKHEIVAIDLLKKPEWFVEKNPLQKVPTLEYEGKLMFESLVVCDYLDEAYHPDLLLHQKDPWQKGHDRVFMELFNKVTSPMYTIYRSHHKGDAEEMTKSFEEVQTALEPFETELSKRGTKFFVGDKPGMLDYMIWPWAERFPAVEMMVGEKISQTRFPKIKSWIEDMMDDPVVKAVYIPPETHKKFLEGMFAGKPDYNL